MTRPVAHIARAACLLAMLALAYALFVCAFQCDDAYITFRTVKNVWNGHGLTWNPGDRVQAYTHPLWMMLCTLVYGATREVYFSITALSAACSIATALGLAWLTRERLMLAAALLFALTASRAFVDFAMSGLENPLLTLLLISAVVTSERAEGKHRHLILSLLVSLIFLTRSDAILLIAPLWLACAARSRPTLRQSALGFAPAVLWQLFSLLYYGSLVPNTAHAKLNLDVPTTQLLEQGLAYFEHSLASDPVTLIVIAASVVAPFCFAAPLRARALSIGIVLYLGYVLRIGGDFMSGRFFAAPFALALANVALTLSALSERAQHRSAVALALSALAYNLIAPFAPIHSDVDYGAHSRSTMVSAEGIADERAFYYPVTGLLPVLVHMDELESSGAPLPPYFGALAGASFARSNDTVAAYKWVGYFGYFAGDKTVIDELALCDPLLARIPYRTSESFRIGHYPRPIPQGYFESYRSGENRLVDPELRPALDAIWAVTRGPLFSSERLRAIFELMSGQYRAAFQGAAQR